MEVTSADKFRGSRLIADAPTAIEAGERQPAASDPFPASLPFQNHYLQREMQALLLGKDWFPNIAGGMNRYFYGEVHSLPSVNVCGVALVSALAAGQSAPMTLRAMAHEHAGLSQRWHGTVRETRRALREGTTLVNAHFALYAYAALRVVPRDIPVVVHFHGPYSQEIAAERPNLRGRTQALMARWMEINVYRRATRVVTLSEAFRDIAHRDYGVPLPALRVLPGGINLAPYLAAPARREARQRLGWPDDRPILLTVRRLARRMGIEGLIDAVGMLRHAHPNVLLLIGGKGALHNELQARIDQKQLTDNVRLLGFVSDSDLPTVFAAADLAVVPTVALEGFGLVTAESLAAGTPVVGTPIGGTPEVLRGLEPRLIFDSTEPSALAERLNEILAGRITLPDDTACRAHASRYGWEVIAPQTRALFDEAIDAARPY